MSAGSTGTGGRRVLLYMWEPERYRVREAISSYYSVYSRPLGLIVKHVAVGPVIVRIKARPVLPVLLAGYSLPRQPPYPAPAAASLADEAEREWPELYRVYLKLRRGRQLDSLDREWLREAARAAGWSVEDMEEELRSLDVDPRGRVERYRRILEEYLAEAERLAREGDTRQAGEKLWGAATALVKLYAALRGVPVVHWSRGRLDRFVDNNVEEPLREKFQQLLDTAGRLHEHFYEDNLSQKGFMDRYNRARRLVEELRKRVYEELYLQH